MACRDQIEKPAAAIFADTGWEDPRTYVHLEFLKREAAAAGIPVLVVSNGNIRDDLLNAAEMKTEFIMVPLFLKSGNQILMGRRECTYNYKMRPVRAKIRELLGITPTAFVPHDAVEVWVGISIDEYQRAAPSRKKWLQNRFPLVEMQMTRGDCEMWLHQHYPGLIVPKSACIGCPFHSKDCWSDISHDEDMWSDVIEVDEAIRTGRKDDRLQFLHSKGIPLAEVDFRTPEDKGQLAFPFYQEERWKFFAKLDIWLPKSN